jgi:hypothetical protein
MLFDVVDKLPQDSKLDKEFIKLLKARAKKLYDTYDLDRRLIFQFNPGEVSLRTGWVKNTEPRQDTPSSTMLEYSNESLNVRQCILSNGTYEYLRPEGDRLDVPEVDQLLLDYVEGVNPGEIVTRNESIKTLKSEEIVGGYRLKKKHRRRKTQNKRKHSRKTRNKYIRKTRNKYIRKTRNKQSKNTRKLK